MLFIGGKAMKNTGDQAVSYAPLVLLALAQFGISSDTTTVALAVNAVVSQLGGGMVDIQLANMVFGLVAGIFMITGGMTGLIIGWNNNFRLGVLLVILGELSMAFAPSTLIFIWAGRVFVGLGASFLIPSVLAIVPTLYHGKKRVFAYGCVAAGAGASALMPIPFGILLDGVGFRVTFMVMMGLFLVLLAFSIRLPRIERTVIRQRFDVLGFITCSVGFFFLLTSVACVSIFGTVDPLPTAPFVLFGIAPTIPMACLGALSLFAFSRVEKSKGKQGMSLLMPRSFLGTSAARHALIAVAFGFFLVGAFNILVIPYMQIAAGATAMQAGILFACSGVPMVFCVMAVPRLLPDASPKRIIRLGYGAGALGCFVIALGLGQSNLFVYVAVGMFITGAGIGLVNSHANNAVACAVGEKDVQQSGGIQGTVRDIAHSLAAALLGTVLALVLAAAFPIIVLGDSTLSEATKDKLTSVSVVFSSDAAFDEVVASAGVYDSEKDSAVEAYGRARLEANQLSLVVLGLGSIALLPFTRNLPSHSTKKESCSADRGL